MPGPKRVCQFLGVVSLAQGVFFFAYAITVVLGVARFGLQGPSEVSNTPGVSLEVLIFLSFGLGLTFVAYGWWKGKRWARAPFLLTQILALVVSVPLMTSTGSAERIIGIVITLVAAVAIVSSLTPTLTRYLLDSEVEPGSN